MPEDYDPDEVRRQALAIARGGEGAIVAEFIRLMHKINELEGRIERLCEIIEEGE